MRDGHTNKVTEDRWAVLHTNKQFNPSILTVCSHLLLVFINWNLYIGYLSPLLLYTYLCLKPNNWLFYSSWGWGWWWGWWWWWGGGLLNKHSFLSMLTQLHCFGFRSAMNVNCECSQRRTYLRAWQMRALKCESSLLLRGVWLEMTVSMAPRRVCLAVMGRPPTMSRWNDCDSFLAGDSLYSRPCCKHNTQ